MVPLVDVEDVKVRKLSPPVVAKSTTVGPTSSSCNWPSSLPEAEVYRAVDLHDCGQDTVDGIRAEECNLDVKMDVSWEVPTEKKLKPPVGDDEEAVEWGSQSADMETIAANPTALRSEEVTLSVAQPEQTLAVASGSTAVVAVVGIAAVSISAMVFGES
ncbi:hypothetical protein PR003_g5122 [Phytophthora rubi]|uniref:Uncharacterized protein n=1 Tax=Phytophthora rubi TaxID=129364 RepID=A0A6A3G5M8_9STRA|nr:hypothetical protein PR002_g32274 [Phytophthora rubi]KAE8953937.1 hypothetical protein PR001_g32691 [Phytophthora rubi]KAE9350958.1 hypothetical protein PR003_g5122 [Phytophthora rubi]